MGVPIRPSGPWIAAASKQPCPAAWGVPSPPAQYGKRGDRTGAWRFVGERRLMLRGNRKQPHPGRGWRKIHTLEGPDGHESRHQRPLSLNLAERSRTMAT
jgi:hypothetical protein